MNTDLFLKMILSYFAIFGGVYLLVTAIEILEDYLRERKLIHHLNRIEEKIDRVPCSLEREIDKELEERWWIANR